MQQWDDAMKERDIAEGVEKRPYFEAAAIVPVSEQDDGTRDMGNCIHS